MNRHDVQAIRPKRLQHAGQFAVAHRDVARDDRVGIGAGESRPGVEAHACIDAGAVLAQVDIRTADRDLVNRAVLLAFGADDRRERFRIERAGCRGRGRRCGGRRLLHRGVDQRHRRLEPRRQVGRLAVSMHVHVKDARLIPEEVIVQRRHFKAVLEQRRHHGVDLVFGQHQITHHDVRAVAGFCKGDPAAKTKRCRRRPGLDRDVQIRAGDVDLEHGVLEVASAAKRGQHRLIVRRGVLSSNLDRDENVQCYHECDGWTNHDLIIAQCFALRSAEPAAQSRGATARPGCHGNLRGRNCALRTRCCRNIYCTTPTQSARFARRLLITAPRVVDHGGAIPERGQRAERNE